MQLGSTTLTAWPTTCADAGHKLQFNSNNAFICGCEFGFTLNQATGGCTPPVTNTSNSTSGGVSTITVAGGATVVAGSALFTDAVSMAGTLAVTGASTLGGALAVTGASTLGGALAVTGAATLGGAVNVTGALRVGGNSITAPPVCVGTGASLQYSGSAWTCMCAFTGVAWTNACALPSSLPTPPTCNATYTAALLYANGQFFCKCTGNWGNTLDNAQPGDCSTCKPGWNPKYGCSMCLPGYDYSVGCKQCSMGAAKDSAGNCVCTGTNGNGFNYAKDAGMGCYGCINAGYDSMTGCTTCKTGYQPLSIHATDMATSTNPQCTQCLPGYDPMTGCMTCLTLGRDPANNCATCLSGLELDNSFPQECVCAGATPGSLNYAAVRGNTAPFCRTCINTGYNQTANCTTCNTGYQTLTRQVSDSQTVNNPGCTQCASGYTGPGCAMCSTPGRDPATGCSTCLSGLILDSAYNICVCPSTPNSPSGTYDLLPSYYQTINGVLSLGICNRCLFPTYAYGNQNDQYHCTSCDTFNSLVSTTSPWQSVSALLLQSVLTGQGASTDPPGCTCMNGRFSALYACQCRKSSTDYLNAMVTGTYNPYSTTPWSCGCAGGPTPPSGTFDRQYGWDLLDPNPAYAEPCSVCKAGYTATSGPSQPPTCVSDNASGG